MTDLKSDHKRHLLRSFAYVDKLLSDIEWILLFPNHSRSVFKKYTNDLEPATIKAIQDQIEKIRAAMLKILVEKEIEMGCDIIDTARSIDTHGQFANISIEEVRAKHMKGYGELTPKAKKELDDIASTLQCLLEKIQIKSGKV